MHKNSVGIKSLKNFRFFLTKKKLIETVERFQPN